MSGFSRSVGRPLPTKYDYVINYETASNEQYFGDHISYEDMLLAHGPDAQGFTDITQMATRFFEEQNMTLSNDMNPFYDMIAASGGVMDVDHPYVRWKSFGKPEREIRSYGNPNPSDADCLGAQGTEFTIRVNSPFLKPGNVLAPLENKNCGVIIRSECSSVGGAYDYEVILEDPNATFPVEFFKAGERWIKRGAHTGMRNSGQAGTIEFGKGFSWIEYEIAMTTMQWKYSVEEEALLAADHISIQRCRQPGSKIIADEFDSAKKFINFLDLEMKQGIQNEVELALVYGQAINDAGYRDIFTSSEIKASPGLMQWMNQAQNISYSPTQNGINVMMANLQAMWFDKIPINKRKIVLYTGEAGAQLFHNWVNELYGETVQMSKEDLILGDTAPFVDGASTGKSLKSFMFTKYEHPSWGEIRIAHWPLLDNTRINTSKFPNSFYPTSSYEFWAFDIGFGEPNIKLLNRPSKERSLYYPGTIAPNGAVGPNNPIWKTPLPEMGDTYEYRYRKSFGLVSMRMDALVRFRPNIA